MMNDLFLKIIQRCEAENLALREKEKALREQRINAMKDAWEIIWKRYDIYKHFKLIDWKKGIMSWFKELKKTRNLQLTKQQLLTTESDNCSVI